jgi:hypothetical protein
LLALTINNKHQQLLSILIAQVLGAKSLVKL